MNHQDVIKAIEVELKKTYPFNHGNGHELWQIIQNQEISPDLKKVITDWAVGRDDKDVTWGVDSMMINTIVDDPRIKSKLLEALDGMRGFLHIVVHPLVKNWGQDADVIERLQKCLDEGPINQSSWIAGYAYEIYQGMMKG